MNASPAPQPDQTCPQCMSAECNGKFYAYCPVSNIYHDATDEVMEEQFVRFPPVKTTTLHCLPVDQHAALVSQLTHLQAQVERLQQEKTTAVQDAVADVLRQVRWPVMSAMSGNMSPRGRNQHLGMMIERERTNDACLELAQRYGVDLGPVPEVSTEF